MSVGNIFANIPTNLDEELFEEILSKEGVKIERIVSQGQISDEWYDQDENEWVIVLQGSAKLVFEDGEEIHLHVGDHINIPAHKKHRVIWTPKDEQTVWLAVFY